MISSMQKSFLSWFPVAIIVDSVSVVSNAGFRPITLAKSAHFPTSIHASSLEDSKILVYHALNRAEDTNRMLRLGS